MSAHALSFGRLFSVALICSNMTAIGIAADPAETTIKGKVSAVETKGKTTTLTLQEDGGTTRDVVITPKLELEIRQKASKEFFIPGLVARIDSTESNNAYFANRVDIFDKFDTKVTTPKIVKAPAQVGQSVNRHFVTGEVVRYEQTEGEKYGKLALKSGPKGEMEVYVEPNAAVTVVLTDPKKITTGQAVTLIGRQAGAKFQATLVTITSDEKPDAAALTPTKRK